MELIELELPDGNILDFQIAFVQEPATESSFQAFKKTSVMKFQEVDKARKIVMGYFMIADMEIDRYDEQRGAYKVKFPKASIEKIVENWSFNGLNKNLNEDHNTNEFAQGVYVLEHWTIDSKLGKVAPTAFKQEPDGSWFGVVKCMNDEIYQKCLDGTYTGFSVESIFVENKFGAMEELDRLLKSL